MAIILYDAGEHRLAQIMKNLSARSFKIKNIAHAAECSKLPQAVQE
jgi:hypothetical protein